MKKFNFMSEASGAAVLLLGALAFSACSSDDLAADVNPTYNGETVKTQFAINIPYAGSQGTRMTDVNTQENNGFLGMYNIRLIPVTTTPESSTPFTSILSLENISSTPTDTENESWTATNGFRKIYNDVNVPVGTKNFLFYGAGGTAAPTTVNEKFAKGVITADIAGSNTSDLSFTLEKAKGTDTGTTPEVTKLLNVLNAVASVIGWSTTTNSELSTLYSNFTSLTAGSANSICMTLQNLYNSVNELAIATAESTEKTIALAIQSAIVTDGVFTVTRGNAKSTLSTTLTYPANINMPDGSASVSFSNGTFTATATGVITTSPSISMDNICYPPSIYYFVNTTLKATDDSEVTWPASLTDWTGASAFTGWDDEVQSSTRTIALTSPIQYGVAKLKTTVKCSSNSLLDNKNNYISVPTDGFEVTGILIGGQPASSDYALKPTGEVSKWTNVIYDNAVPAGMAAKASGASSANYTLAMDNYAATAQKVYIALELKNTSTSDFYGNDGIVPAGGTFYLVAELDPTSKTVDGVTNPYVFMQDYTTTLDLTIKSLANAYNVIPDLRASQMQLGLAVDLEWKAGISFTVDIN